jgi:transcriptional regulator with XRE-family HTH domain
MSIGNNIKALRKEHGLSQKELAIIAGVTDKAVSAWETGKKDPRMGVIEKIANHFGILKSTIIEGSHRPSFDVSIAEREHIKKYRALTKEHQEAIDVQLDFFFKKDTTIEVTIPVDENGDGAALLRRLDVESEKENRGGK